MNDLNITIVQADIQWRSNKDNLIRYTKLIENLQDTDLLVFPEMFQTGFCTEPAGVAEKMDGETVRWMKRTAEKYKCAVAGSLIIKENRSYFNRLIFIDPYENMTWYDKRHLFCMEGEESKYTSGNSRLTVPINGWKISFQICYDLRFPVWSRNSDNYDVLINSASWPSNRNDVWTTLLKARAIENQSYVVGVNRIGVDGNNYHYTGNSLVFDPKGTVMGALPESHEGLLSVTLSRDVLDKFRKEFPVLDDRDTYEISI